MVKDATTRKAWLTPPRTLWVSLLVSRAVVNGLPLEALADEVPGTVGIYHLPHKTDSVKASAEAVMPIAVVTDSGKGTRGLGLGRWVNSSTLPQPIAPTLSGESVSHSTENRYTNVSSVAKLTSKEEEIETNKVQGTVATPLTTTLEATPVDASAEAPILSDVTSVTEFSSAQEDINANEPMSQITNVSQLRDVFPGDWAYEALRSALRSSASLSLVERYGCIAGYPDGTFRGNRATSRYEFAAGLNACLQQIERLIANGAEGLATRF